MLHSMAVLFPKHFRLEVELQLKVVKASITLVLDAASHFGMPRKIEMYFLPHDVKLYFS